MEEQKVRKPHANKWVPTPEILSKIEQQAKLGITEANIARNVGISPTAFSEKKQHYPEIQEAIKKGSARGEELASGALWNMITDEKHKGHLTAVIFYLKTRHGWSDGSKQGSTEVVAPSGIQFEVIQKGEVKAKAAPIDKEVLQDVYS